MYENMYENQYGTLVKSIQKNNNYSTNVNVNEYVSLDTNTYNSVNKQANTQTIIPPPIISPLTSSIEPESSITPTTPVIPPSMIPPPETPTPETSFPTTQPNTIQQFTPIDQTQEIQPTSLENSALMNLYNQGWNLFRLDPDGYRFVNKFTEKIW